MRYTTAVRGASLVALVAAAPAVAQVPSVVAEMPVTHSLVAMVMGDLAEPVLLLDRGADAHDFALRPSQAQAVANAGLVVWMGPQMTQWMERAVSSLSEGADLRLLAVEGTHLQPFSQSRLTGLGGGHEGHDHGSHASHDEHDHHGDHDDHDHHADHDEHDHHGDHDDHDHHADHAEHASHDGHGHDHSADGADPHAWLDPHNARVWLGAIAEQLAALDPANAETYRANATAARAEVAALEAEVAAILAPVGDAGLVVYHDAYGYFAGHFGVNVLGSVALGDAAAPGAARLREIRATLEGAGAVCAFPEVNHSDAFVALATEGSSLRIGAALDPEGSALEPGAALYGDLLRALARNIADCVTAG